MSKFCIRHFQAFAAGGECPKCHGISADIWKEHARVFMRAAAEQGNQARIAETNGANEEALVCRVLSCAFDDIAKIYKRYESKAAQETEG